MNGLRTVVPAERAQGSRIRVGTRPEEGPDPLDRDRRAGARAFAHRHVAGDFACARYRKELRDEHIAETGLSERTAGMERAAGREPKKARDLSAAKLDETAAAARARLVLFVMDEPGGPGGVTELDGERPHDVRVTLFDLEQRSALLRIRRRVDPSTFSDRARASHASRLDACALSFDIRETVAKGEALTEVVPGR